MYGRDKDEKPLAGREAHSVPWGFCRGNFFLIG